MPSESADERYENLRLKLAHAVSGICPHWLADQKEDIVQKAMIKVIQLVRKSEGEREFSPFYLRRLAYCVMVDEIRRLQYRKEVLFEDCSTASVVESRSGVNPESTAAAREIGLGILECLKEMPRHRRIAVTLYLQGHRVPEVAELVGWDTKKAENLVYRGLAALRSCLASKDLKP